MAKICDRSPCDDLLKSLGVWIFGSSEGFYVQVLDRSPETSEVTISYCPFCGTRLEEVGQLALEKYLVPRRRKRPNLAVT